MKKLVTILLALAMILCLSTSAFADTPVAEDTIVNITNPIGDTPARDYAAFQILNLSTSHKDPGHDVNCPKYDDENAECLDTCFNYRYTFNDKYKEILQEEVANNDTEALWTTNNMVAPATAADVTETHALVYLASMSSDAGTTAGSLRAVADRIYRAIKAAGLGADDTLKTGNDNVLEEQGYWLIADVTAGLDEYDAHSLVILDTKADSHITLNPKVALPTVEKKVKDTNDSESDNMEDHAWVDAADHDIDGNYIPFKLTATLPYNVASYTTYTMTFVDTMDPGLTLKTDSFKVYLYNTKNTADGDNNMDGSLTGVIYESGVNGLDTDNFKVEVTENGFNFIVKNALNLGDTKTFNAIVVTYEAKLDDENIADVKLGKEGNKNTVKLVYSNDPYGTGTGETTEDVVKVFTYGLQIDKIDGHNHPLAGAEFKLYKVLKSGAEELVTTLETPTDMQFIWKGLDNGKYILKETTPPEGFNPIDDIAFVITSSLEQGDPALKSFQSEFMGTGNDDGYIVKEIANYTGTVLPSTGAKGTFMLITAGTVLVVLAAVFMITRKKMSIYED